MRRAAHQISGRFRRGLTLRWMKCLPSSARATVCESNYEQVCAAADANACKYGKEPGGRV